MASVRYIVDGDAVRVKEYGFDFIGFRDGWRGPLEGLTSELGIAQVRGILPRGGTILGSSRTNPFTIENGVEQIKKTYRKLMSQVHPDRVASLGPDRQKAALERAQALLQLASEPRDLRFETGNGATAITRSL